MPFFWRAHRDVTSRRGDHACTWDDIRIDGDCTAYACAMSYRKDGRTLAVATNGCGTPAKARRRDRPV